jgi:hypothetical protein
VVAALFGFGVTAWYDRKGLHRMPAETISSRRARETDRFLIRWNRVSLAV